MIARPHTRALLLLSLLNASALSASEPAEKDAEEPKVWRSIRPTESDLEPFRLPRKPEGEDHASPAPMPSWFELSGVGMFAASAADIASTEWGLSRGLREANPVASERGIRIAHHVIGPAAVWWSTERLKRSGKSKLALTLRISLMLAYSYATIHNVRQVHSTPGLP